MNTAQAKQIPIADLLEALGYEPQRVVHGEHWYLSPFRQETDASFKLSRDGKAWYDHGAAEGGTIIDFVIRYYGLGHNDVAGALQLLRSFRTGATHQADRDPAQQSLWQERRRDRAAHAKTTEATPEETASPAMTVTKIQPVQNQALKHYLKRRAVDGGAAARYLQEIHYRRLDKAYFALAFANESGGFELRNPYYQGTLGTKDVTLLLPDAEASGSSVAVFEGFMDFLSAVTFSGKQALDGMAIVMNSASMRERTLKVIQGAQIGTIDLYLDHDATGRALTAWFQEQLQDRVVEDQSGFYAAYKDLNEWLMAQNKVVSR